MALSCTLFLLLLVPQDVPLEFCPPFAAARGRLCLQICCNVTQAGELRLWYSSNARTNDYYSVRWPVKPSDRAYTYSFPLPDAPLCKMLIGPLAAGGTLAVRDLRIVDGSGIEVYRATAAAFRPAQQIASIVPTTDGVEITSVRGAREPKAQIVLEKTIAPQGMNGRNLLRCASSVAYVALLTFVLMLATYWPFHEDRNRRNTVPTFAGLLLLAVIFSLVANRRLLWDSVLYANHSAARTATHVPRN